LDTGLPYENQAPDFLDQSPRDGGLTVQGAISSPHLSAEVSQEASPAGAASNAFAADLYAQLPQTGNLLFSPLSIQMAMAMTMTAAAGETRESIEAGLHLDFADSDREMGQWLRALNAPAETYTLRLSSRLWHADDLSTKPQFQELSAMLFNVYPESLSFEEPEAARQVINDWVAEETDSLIPELVPSGALTPQTRLVLSNAVYFLADWERPFDPDETAERPFDTPTGVVSVPFMNATADQLVGTLPGAKTLVLPYAGGAQELVLLLPDEGRSIDEFGPESLTAAAASVSNQFTELALPTLALDWKQSLVEHLVALGMGPAFSTQADFSTLSDEDLMLSEVIHQSFLKMDEQGTEAAAVTGVTMKPTSMPPPPQVTMIVDRPYLFGVLDVDSGALLFVARVESPL
jgi:serpin B